MQPMNGLNVAARRDLPTYDATNTTEREVVIPGFTGLPSCPEERDVDRRRTLSSASSPPTTWPRGHVSWNSTRVAATPVAVGHDDPRPGDRDADHAARRTRSRPPPGGREPAAAASVTSTRRTEDAVTQTLLKRNAESRAPDEQQRGGERRRRRR